MIRSLGGRVVEIPSGESGEAVLQEVAASAGYAVLRDGHDDRIAIGAGTLALEVTDVVDADWLPSVGAVFVPIGDGSLIAGVGTWIRVVSIHTSYRRPGRFPRRRWLTRGAARALRSCGRPRRVRTVWRRESGNADLLGVLRDVVDDMVIVREEQLLAAQRQLHDELGIRAEASAAASWLAARDSGDGGPTAGGRLVIVTGSNAWPDDFAASS